MSGHIVIPPARSSAQEATAIAAAIATEVTNRNTAIAAEATARDAAIAVSSKQFDDVVEPVIPRRNAGLLTAAPLIANTVYFYRFRVDRAITIANAKVYNGATVAGNLAVGVYTLSGSTWSLVAHTADTAASGANAIQTIALTSPATYALVPGTDYWAAFGATDATYTPARGTSLGSSNMGIPNNDCLSKAAVYSSGLPSQILTPTGAAFPYWIALTT